MSAALHTLPVLRTKAELYAACEKVRREGKRVGFVPTMGALHEGHLSLVQRAKRSAEWVVASIFVNPTQFGPNEDFDRYPRDLDSDARKLARVGTDAVFVPSVEEMYPKDEATRVNVRGLSETLCGPFRPGHFEGVATIVTKLLSAVGPCTAVFGRKDYQQLAILRRLAADLCLPVEVVGAPIERDPDGLAMSSRNAYLSKEERDRSLALSRGLFSAADLFGEGERDVSRLLERVTSEVTKVTNDIDYISCADADTLRSIEGQTGDRALLALAVRIGTTRLIDNFVLGEDKRKKG